MFGLHLTMYAKVGLMSYYLFCVEVTFARMIGRYVGQDGRSQG